MEFAKKLKELLMIDRIVYTRSILLSCQKRNKGRKSKMVDTTNVTKRLWPVAILAGLVIMLVGGCGQLSQGPESEPTARAQVWRDDIKTSEAYQEKARLLSQIETRYENADAHYKLGKLHHADGLWEKAKWEFNVALGFEPMHNRSQAALVRTFLAGGQDAQAKLGAGMYINQAAVSPQASFLLGQAFQKEILDDYALTCYQQAMGMAPNSAVIHKQIGYYYLSRGDRARAEEYLRRSFQLDPYQPEVAGQLGRLGIRIQVPRREPKNARKLDKQLRNEKLVP